MSNLQRPPAESPEQTLELLEGREVTLSPRDGTVVTRTLPNKERRMVWRRSMINQCDG